MQSFAQTYNGVTKCLPKLWKHFKNDEQGFYALKIRQLRIVAKQINLEEGEIICKRQFAKSVSEMRKNELAACCWYVFSLRNSRPHGGCEEVRHVEGSNRIISLVDKNNLAWTTNLGFETQSQARELFNYLMADVRRATSCSLASIRPATRCVGSQWEVKVWCLNGGLLKSAINKEVKRLAVLAEVPVEIPVVIPDSEAVASLRASSQPEPEIDPNIPTKGVEVSADELVDRYQSMYDKAINDTARAFVADRIYTHKLIELIDGKVWLKRHWNELISVLIKDAATLRGCFIKGDFDSLNSSQQIQYNGRVIGTIAWINGGYQICPEPGANLAKWYPVKDPEDGMLQLLDHAGALAF